MTVLLKRKATLLANLEDVYGTPVPLGLTDAVLCSNPTFSTDPNLLERDFTSDTLSPQAHIIGRMMTKVEFETELRSNNKAQSGIPADAPIIADLFQACGFRLTGATTPTLHGPFQADDGGLIVFSADTAAAATNTDVIDYSVVIVAGGANPTASVVSKITGEASAAKAFTSGAPFALGTKGLSITPTFTANSLVPGQRFNLWLLPKGLKLQPVSDDALMKSATIEIYQDKIKHVVPGCFGSFEITAQAGQFATVKWTFWGLYLNPVTGSPPTVSFEKSLPAQIEFARLNVDGFQAIVDKFSYNQQNDVNIRPDVNSSQGYIGTRITNRKPTGGIDPEADLVENHDFWGRLNAATRMAFQMRVGTKPGNTVWMFAPSTQYSGMTYQDRNGIMTFDAGLKFSRVNGDDEFALFFM
jgi:hypothetical protein